MPSIQQVIAEIQLATDLPPGHIAKAVQIIRDAERRLKLRGSAGRPRKVTGAKNLVSIQDWEKQFGVLKESMMRDWVDGHGLCRQMVAALIDEFRGEMIAKGKQYANFKAAFMTYLSKGYLSKTREACLLERSSFKPQTTVDKRGVNL